MRWNLNGKALGVALTLFAGSEATAQLVDPTDLGGDLWAWAWAGDQGEHLTLVKGNGGTLISEMRDLSGRGHHFYNYGGKQSGYQAGLSLPSSTKGGAYQTDLPVVGLDKFQGGTQLYGNVFYQDASLDAAGEFYLASVCMNTRKTGERELFGATAKDFVRLDQQRENVTITISGAQQKLCPDGKLPAGILLLEIWRDRNGQLTCMANGVDVTVPGAKQNGLFALSGLGYDRVGTSQWDDFWMEFVICDALPDAAKRDELREYLRGKWGVFAGTRGGSSPAPRVFVSPPDQTLLQQPQPFDVFLQDDQQDLGWIEFFVTLDSNPFTRIRLPFDWFQLSRHADGSMDVHCLYALPTSGYQSMEFQVIVLDRAGNSATQQVQYFAGQ